MSFFSLFSKFLVFVLNSSLIFPLSSKFLPPLSISYPEGHPLYINLSLTLILALNQCSELIFAEIKAVAVCSAKYP